MTKLHSMEMGTVKDKEIKFPYLTRLSLSKLYNVEPSAVDEWIEKYLEGCSSCFIQVWSWRFPGGTQERHEKPQWRIVNFTSTQAQSFAAGPTVGWEVK